MHCKIIRALWIVNYDFVYENGSASYTYHSGDGEEKKECPWEQTLYNTKRALCSKSKRLFARNVRRAPSHNVLTVKRKFWPPPFVSDICITFIPAPNLHFSHYSFCISSRNFPGREGLSRKIPICFSCQEKLGNIVLIDNIISSA